MSDKSKDHVIMWGGEMFALTNYGAVKYVAYYRRMCVAEGVSQHGEHEFRRLLRKGVYDIRRVKVSGRP